MRGRVGVDVHQPEGPRAGRAGAESAQLVFGRGGRVARADGPGGVRQPPPGAVFGQATDHLHQREARHLRRPLPAFDPEVREAVRRQLAIAGRETVEFQDVGDAVQVCLFAKRRRLVERHQVPDAGEQRVYGVLAPVLHEPLAGERARLVRAAHVGQVAGPAIPVVDDLAAGGLLGGVDAVPHRRPFLLLPRLRLRRAAERDGKGQRGAERQFDAPGRPPPRRGRCGARRRADARGAPPPHGRRCCLHGPANRPRSQGVTVTVTSAAVYR